MIPIVLFAISLVHGGNFTCDQAYKIMDNASDSGGNVSNGTLQEAIKDYNMMKCDEVNSYQDGYNQGIRDWNSTGALGGDLKCPLANTAPRSDYCKGYDAAIMFETSDQ